MDRRDPAANGHGPARGRAAHVAADAHGRPHPHRPARGRGRGGRMRPGVVARPALRRRRRPGGRAAAAGRGAAARRGRARRDAAPAAGRPGRPARRRPRAPAGERASVPADARPPAPPPRPTRPRRPAGSVPRCRTSCADATNGAARPPASDNPTPQETATRGRRQAPPLVPAPRATPAGKHADRRAARRPTFPPRRPRRTRGGQSLRVDHRRAADGSSPVGHPGATRTHAPPARRTPNPTARPASTPSEAAPVRLERTVPRTHVAIGRMRLNRPHPHGEGRASVVRDGVGADTWAIARRRW